MTLFVVLLLLANGLITYYCYINAKMKGYPIITFSALGLLPYFNLVVLVYLLFLPNLKNHSEIEQNSIIS
ncbi:hypothetical protein [Pseudoalteromonas denitrificans]|uniref:Uncharacterized protein n=1 Tax=Pseudoalteromonas denitrificans DSM 6059 TaxID=1123010 RepID=A0A1I1DVV0_9GAMM|nr:hypothetical protein [Pseudoalteromonas denitrificans]SFB78957.1 hypothetical protein SAMN02745724_00084 [Pseudoalteromonas denitrificans DSM 6059]